MDEFFTHDHFTHTKWRLLFFENKKCDNIFFYANRHRNRDMEHILTEKSPNVGSLVPRASFPFFSLPTARAWEQGRREVKRAVDYIHINRKKNINNTKTIFLWPIKHAHRQLTDVVDMNIDLSIQSESFISSTFFPPLCRRNIFIKCQLCTVITCEPRHGFDSYYLVKLNSGFPRKRDTYIVYIIYVCVCVLRVFGQYREYFNIPIYLYSIDTTPFIVTVIFSMLLYIYL